MVKKEDPTVGTQGNLAMLCAILHYCPGTTDCCHIAGKCGTNLRFFSIQAYSYLSLKHPHSPTREELQAFFDDLKASTAMPSHRLDNK